MQNMSFSRRQHALWFHQINEVFQSSEPAAGEFNFLHDNWTAVATLILSK